MEAIALFIWLHHKMKLLAITVNTENDENSRAWEDTATKHRFPHVVLGRGDTWQGWKWRTQTYLNYIKSRPDIDVFLLLDGNDLYFVADVEEFMAKFQAMNSDIVIGSERQCCTGKWTKANVHEFAKKLHAVHANTNSPYIYLNGGAVMGYREPLIELLEDIKNESDDQAGYVEQFFLNPKRLVLDYNQSIIGNHAHDLESPDTDIWQKDQSDGRIFNTITGQKPVIMHFPGSNKTKFVDYQRFLENEISAKNAKIEELQSMKDPWRKLIWYLVILILIIVGIICVWEIVHRV